MLSEGTKVRPHTKGDLIFLGYKEATNDCDIINIPYTMTYRMYTKYGGRIATIVDVRSSSWEDVVYALDIDGGEFIWTERMFKPVVEVTDCGNEVFSILNMFSTEEI